MPSATSTPRPPFAILTGQLARCGTLHRALDLLGSLAPAHRLVDVRPSHANHYHLLFSLGSGPEHLVIHSSVLGAIDEVFLTSARPSEPELQAHRGQDEGRAA
jgi:hypothetical protein